MYIVYYKYSDILSLVIIDINTYGKCYTIIIIC